MIDFGVGDPDRPTPTFIVDRLAEAVRDARYHRYSPGIGTPEFRRAAANYLARRFRADVDADTEILALIGSKEGIGHLPTAVVNPGDVVLVPEPGYPLYTAGTVFSGGTCIPMPRGPDQHRCPRL